MTKQTGMQEYRDATDQANAHYQRSLAQLTHRKRMLSPRLKQAWAIVTELATQSAHMRGDNHPDKEALNLRLATAYQRANALDHHYLKLLIAESALVNELE